MNHLEEFTKTTPNHIIKWVLKERQQQPWSLSQQGLVWWQPSEPRDKIHRVNFVYSSRWFAFSKSQVLYLHSYISFACVVALVIS